MTKTIPTNNLDVLRLIEEHISVSENARIHKFKKQGQNYKWITIPPTVTPGGL